MAVRMLQRRGTAAQWSAKNPVLGDGEMGIATDVGIIKIGDGENPWEDLDIVYEATPSVISVAGRTGDIVLTTDDLADLTVVGASVLGAGSPDDLLLLLGATTLGTNLLRAQGPIAARELLEATTVGAAVLMAASAAAARSAIGITQIGAGVVTAVDNATARAAIGAGTGNGDGNVVGTGVTKIVSLTQADYDALVTKDSATLYAIVG